MKEKVTIAIDAKILRSVDSYIDKVYIRNRSQAISYLLEHKLWRDKVAVILATGPSEQLRITKSEYRPTAHIGDKTVIELALSTLRDNGFKKIYVIGEQQILTSIFNVVGNGHSHGVHVEFVEDKNPPGNAASLRLLKGEITSPFLVVFGDILFSHVNIDKLWKHHFTNNGIATLMATQCSLTKGGKVVPIKYSILNVEGNRVKKVHVAGTLHDDFEEGSMLTYSSILVAEPSLLEYSGNWLDSDVFPPLAEKKLLYSYISEEAGFHIHSKEDARIAHSLHMEVS